MKFHDTYWLISLFLVLLTAQNLFADESQKGLLWQIEKPGLTPSYIFGTIHSEDPRVNKLPPIVLPRFEQAKSASFEILMDMPNLLKVASAMFFTGEQSLDKLIDETLYLSVVKALRQHQMPATMVKRLKPWAVVMTLSSPPMKTGEFLDLLLYQKAQRLQIPTYGLEKVEEQLAVFDDISLDELYLQRDLTTLLKFSIEEMKNGSDNLSLVDSFYERLVDDRNIRMVKRMEARLQEGNAFIAIGALHLPGKKGVLKLLQERGYQVLAMY